MPSWERRSALITITVMLGMIMAIIDTTIVNVAIQTIGGNLGATVDEVAWVATGYILANVIVMPLNGWLTALLGRKRFTPSRWRSLRSPRSCAARRTRSGCSSSIACCKGSAAARCSRPRRRSCSKRFRRSGAGGDGDLRHGRDGRAGDRTDARRLDRRQRHLAADLLHQHSDRHRGVSDDAGVHSEPELHRSRRAASTGSASGCSRRGWRRCSTCSSAASTTTGSTRRRS